MTRIPMPAMLQVEQTLMLNATPDRVFAALTQEIAAWWGPAYRMSALSRGLIMEQHVGGRFYEDWGQGQGTLWGIVTAFKRDELLELTGRMGMRGAVHSVVYFILEADGERTKLTFSHHASGEIHESYDTDFTEGWDDLLTNYLQPCVEKERLASDKDEARMDIATFLGPHAKKAE